MQWDEFFILMFAGVAVAMFVAFAAFIMGL